MTRFSALFSLLFLVVVTGCSFQDVSSHGVAAMGSDADTATATCAATRTALVPRPSGTTAAVSGLSGAAEVDAFGLPKQNVFQFRTCLIDRATTQPLRGITVVVSGGEQPQTVTANALGCIDWTETVAYRRLAAERLLAWTRTLETSGGRLRLDLALNPWAKTSEALVDYSGDRKPVGLVEGKDAVRSALLGIGENAPARALGKELTNLRASQLVVRRSEAGVGDRGSRVDYRLAFTLAARRRTLDGSWVPEELTAGTFKVTVSAWEQRAKEPAELLAKPVTVDRGTYRDGQLEVAATLEYERALADGADLHVKYVIEPADPEKLLLASEGWMQLRRGHTSDSALPSLVAPGTVRDGDVRPGPSGPGAAVGVQIQSLTVTKFKVGAVRGWSLPIDVRARVCLVTADDQQAIPATSTRQFSFQISSSPTPDATWSSADEFQNNCWIVRKAEATSCDIAKREEYLPMYLHLRGEDPRFKGVLQTRRFALNPWQRDRQEQFFVDLPEDRKPPPLDPPGGDGVSQLILQNLTYEFAGVTTEANEFLQRVGLRQYRLTLRPKLWSPWRSHSGHDETESVFRGMKFRAHGIFSTPPKAAVAPNVSQYLGEFVSDFEVADNGEASKTILLPVDFPEAHRLRSAVVLTLRLVPLPVNDAKRPHARVYRLTFDPIVDRSNGNSRNEASFLARELSATDFLALIPTGTNEPPKGAFDGAEQTIPRSPAVQKWELDGTTGYGMQPKFRGTPTDLFARYWKDTVGVRPIHLSKDRRADGWADWTGDGVRFPDAEKAPVALPEFDRNALLEGFLDGPVARGASVRLPGAVLRGLCTYYAAGDEKCTAEPGRFFDAVTTFVAGKVTAPSTVLSPVDSEGQFAQKITVQASFFKETGYQERAGRGDKSAVTASVAVQGKLGAENLGTGGGIVGSVGYSTEMFHSTEIGVTDGLRNRRSSASAYELFARKFSIDLRVDGDACLLVRPFVSGNGRPRPALLYCATVNNVDRTESWYELLDSATGASSVVGDPSNPAEKGWLRTIRGDAALLRLRQRLMDDTAGAVFHKIGPWIERFSANLTRSPNAMIEGTAADDFSKEGVLAIMGRDGGLFPGVFEIQPAVASFRENWSEKAFNEKAHAVYEGVVSAGLERSQIPFVVQKDDKNVERRVPDVVTEAKRSQTLNALRQARAYSRCLVAEYARRCTLGLYEADRPLCLAKNRKEARAKLQPELEAERKRINGACAELAKGAFP